MEHGQGLSCGCHGHGGSQEMHHGGGVVGHGNRHFYTRQEMTDHLGEYLAYLKAEMAGVEEELSRLKS